MNYCKKCGARLEDGAKFCTSCGTKCDPPKRPTAASPRQHWFSPPPPLEETPAQEQPASQSQEAPAQEQPASQPQEAPAQEQSASQPQEIPAQEQSASQPQEAPEQEQPASQPQEAPAQEQPATQPQEAPEQEQPVFQPQEGISEQKTQYASEEFEVVSPQRPLFSYQSPQGMPRRQPPFTPQSPQEMFPQQQPPQGMPPRERQERNPRKPLLIVLFSLIGVLVVLGIVFLILFLSKSSAKAKTFDMTCSQYTAEMNRIMGENKLKEDKWKITEANAAYVDEGYKIDLDLDKDSQKIKSIKVGSTDSEEAAKIAAVSIMTVEPDADQESSLRELAEVKEAPEKEIVKEKTVVYIDETEKEYVIEPKPDDKTPQEKTDATTASSQASQTGTTQPQTQTTAAETTAPTETTAPPKTEPSTTEETTAPQSDWKKLYTDFINENKLGMQGGDMVFQSTYALVEIDDDGIPELIINGWTNPAGKHLCWIVGDEVKTVAVGAGGTDSLRYSKHGGTFWYMYMHMATVYYEYSFRNGNADLVHSAFNNPGNNSYTVDDKEADQAAYEAMAAEIQSSGSDAPDYKSKDEILSDIERY